MKIKSVLTILIYALLLSSCVGVTPFPTPLIMLPTRTAPTTTVTTTPAPTNTLTLTPTPRWFTPTPETLYGYPTPEIMVLPTCGSEGCFIRPNVTPEPQRQEIAFYELYVGKYVVRNWCDTDPQVTYFPSCAVIITSKGMQEVEIWGYGTARVSEETGADLTGNGISDIVIHTWNGAANDGSGKIVYEAGDTLTLIMKAHGDGTFIDLNDDGTYEYIAQRRIWSSFPAGGNIWINVVYEYQKNQGYYVLATSKFINQIEEGIQWNFDALAEFEQEHPDASLQFEVFDNNYGPAEISLYRIVAYYLLARKENTALEYLNKYFSEEKATEYLLVIKSDMGSLIEP